MVSRFVVVPAVPTETGSSRKGMRGYCKTATLGFNIYDNEKKLRSQATFLSREEAETECEWLNLRRLQSVSSKPDTL
ncbi:hypothetical protein PS928_03606 [Pseudomonas fluorescens]|uniref:Uncharacterized protein n=1 Tax=Pseudomonas fluorescens TaxID=294 RepID=A0A5E7URV9_PSEFL|nr:hypothetical protein PS928_03606 [Pseudomonas fluorescens]